MSDLSDLFPGSAQAVQNLSGFGRSSYDGTADMGLDAFSAPSQAAIPSPTPPPAAVAPPTQPQDSNSVYTAVCCFRVLGATQTAGPNGGIAQTLIYLAPVTTDEVNKISETKLTYTQNVPACWPRTQGTPYGGQYADGVYVLGVKGAAPEMMQTYGVPFTGGPLGQPGFLGCYTLGPESAPGPSNQVVPELQTSFANTNIWVVRLRSSGADVENGVLWCPGNPRSDYYPLANYIWDFALSWDYNLKGTESDPGSTATSTYIFDMVDDDYTQVISVPVVEGKYSVYFYDTGCAYTGGCVF